MELTENERLMLVRKKEEISKITSELVTGKLTNSEKIARMNEVLSLLSTIESYAKPDRDLSVFQRLVLRNTLWLESGLQGDMMINLFCTSVNSIKFDFTKRRLKLADTIIINIENVLAKFPIGK
jgi:hypothetical protein